MKLYNAIKNQKGNIAVDDTILVEGVPATAGSYMLEGFCPLFSAEAVTRLEENGYVVAGKTHVGEFALDLVGEFSHTQKQENTLGAAAAIAVASDEVLGALAVDVNGAPRRGASLAGVDFLKPTYGTVSRYGVISTAASGETVGVYAKNAEGIAALMAVVAGHDDKDGTSLPEEKYTYDTTKSVAGKKVCIIKELYEKADEKTREKLDNFAASLIKCGVSVKEISLDLFSVAATAWQILSTAETCNNISRYDGVKFGHRAEKYKNIDELYVNSRTEGFNLLTKTVILYGSDVLSKTRYKDCYDRSLRVRRVVKERFDVLMREFDAVLTPACAHCEYAAYDIADAFMKVFDESVFTALPNLIGTPALVCGGVQLMGKHFDESLLLSLANAVEKEAK